MSVIPIIIPTENENSGVIYSKDALEKYEFKTIKSTKSFDNIKFFKKIIEEEKENGWEMFEKISDFTLRFKRPLDKKSFDSKNGIDPYRSLCGNSLLLWIIKNPIITILIGFTIIALIFTSI